MIISDPLISSDPDDSPIQFRAPTSEDGIAIQQLIEHCPPLDRNSTYLYLLLCTHFAESCVVVYDKQKLIGFISAYGLPQDSDTLFIWQVAVAKSARGKQLASRMIEHLLQRPHLAHIRYLQTTVDPENLASRRVFEKIAQHYHTSIDETPFFESHHFIEPQEEPLLHIGPLR